MPRKKRRICFVTGTRAEFGLMASTLRALRDHPAIDLQIIATGSHTQRSRGNTLGEIRRDGWRVDAVIPWPDDTRPAAIARHMGGVGSKLARVYAALASDLVLVVGDRVEAFAAASAGHISGLAVAQVHGGDRAMGQADDSLRHAISKLAHVHLCATPQSGERLFAMGEDRRRIHVVGAPGIDGICQQAVRPASAGDFVLVLLHPSDANEAAEAIRAARLLRAIRKQFAGPIVALLPNADPGSPGIAGVLKREAAAGRIRLLTHADRPAFLGMLRDCRALVGNSSSGIIEAGSFGTPVLDVGPRQSGRERGGNVLHTPWNPAELSAAITRVLAMPRRRPSDNPYDRGGAARRITRILAGLAIDQRLLRKVIRY